MVPGTLGIRQESTPDGTPVIHSHTPGRKSVQQIHRRTSTGFLLCLVEVHDAVDNLYTRVATEERDLIRKRFGGWLGAVGAIDVLRFTAATFLGRLRAPFLLEGIYKTKVYGFLKFSCVLDSCLLSVVHMVVYKSIFLLSTTPTEFPSDANTFQTVLKAWSVWST